VSAAIGADCDRVLTEDLQHGRIIRGVAIQSPFL
jgi:predicted nucleic acid-binding protein